jgi:hypothetical protein
MKSNKFSVIHDLYPPKGVKLKQGPVPLYAWKFLYQLVYCLLNSHLMLLIMTFNTGIFIAVVFGQILGYVIWNMKSDLKYTSDKKCG